MEDKENKPKLLSCMHKGPGPAYRLPTLVGYDGHDPSRHRYPAYSMRKRTGIGRWSVGPGPCYDITKLTNYGLDNSPAYTITGREQFKVHDLGPGPGAHYPERCPPVNHSHRPPAYTIKARGATRYLDRGPGPNAYLLPTCIGPKVPDKPALGAFSISGIHAAQRMPLGPGPAAYGYMDIDIIKRRNPAFSLKSRGKVIQGDTGLGTQYYPLYNTRKQAPVFSFGIRHSECAVTPITAADED